MFLFGLNSYKSVYYWHSMQPSIPSYIYCNGCLLTWNSASRAGIAAAVYFLLLVETTLENLHTSLNAVNQGAAIQPHTNRAAVSGELSQHFIQLHGNISLLGNAWLDSSHFLTDFAKTTPLKRDLFDRFIVVVVVLSIHGSRVRLSYRTQTKGEQTSVTWVCNTLRVSHCDKGP